MLLLKDLFFQIINLSYQCLHWQSIEETSVFIGSICILLLAQPMDFCKSVILNAIV